ncbi:MAG: hypothetical protein U9O18_02185 [Chloroflexota bacterium]|nr:hypothetical protein [Chloroflexota bacterium]
MKRRDLIRQIARAAKAKGMPFKRVRSRRHDVYSLDGLIIPIPRHREIGEGLADDIRKECESKLGMRWWR